MSPAHRALKALLWITGLTMLLALGAVVMPAHWMAATHRWLGLGELPGQPIVGYLARSLSLLYATFGTLLIFMARDVRRYDELIGWVGLLSVVGGATQLGIDFAVGMPAWWAVCEGPTVIVLGAAILLLRRVARRAEKSNESDPRRNDQ
jgi:hypothetical protein